MNKLGKRGSAFAAELLAEHLLHTYQNEQIPQSIEDFARAGFSKKTIVEDPDRLFQMIVLAAYDRRPFTQALGGYEHIWEMGKGIKGVPSLLRSRNLWSVESVLSQTLRQIEDSLSTLKLGELLLNSDGEKTQFSKTLFQASQLVANGFHNQLLETSSTKGTRSVFDHFDSIHGIGETIASKLVKYTLREIGVGKVKPADFSLDVAWPITQEYHAEMGIAILHSLSTDLPALTAGILYQKGDSFAIDSLFYLHRRRKEELESFIRDLRLVITPIMTGTGEAKASYSSSSETCRRLLPIIAEARDDALTLTQQELDQHGITRDLKTAKQVSQSGIHLYQEMERIAQTGSVSEMVRYYENCLNSPDGQLYDWILSKLSCKCLASEKDRFLKIASHS